MDILLANIPLDNNTLLLLLLAVASGISSWVQKRRKTAAEKSRGESAPPPPGPREAAPEAPNLEEILRRLMGGESPPQTSAPPASPASPPPAEPRRGDAPPPVVFREDQPQEETGWREETEPADEAMPPRLTEAVELAPQRISKPLPIPAVFATHPKAGPAAPRLEKLSAPPRHSTMTTSGSRRRRSLIGDRAVAQVRNSRTVRQAFVASLVFGPPKSLESPQS